MATIIAALVLLGSIAVPLDHAWAQRPPSSSELSAYRGLHRAAAEGSIEEIRRLVRSADVNARDSNGRTPLHFATFRGHGAAAQALIEAGADPHLLDDQRYDAVTIAAVRDEGTPEGAPRLRRKREADHQRLRRNSAYRCCPSRPRRNCA